MDPIADSLVPDTPRQGEGAAIAKPYGLIGLCISLIAILSLTLVYGAIAGVVVYGCVFGWAHLIEIVGQSAMADHGGTGIFIGLVQDDLGHALVLPLTLSLLVYVAICLSVLTLARFRGGGQWRELIAWRFWSPRKTRRTTWLIAGVTLIYSFIANALLASYYPPSKDWFTVPKDDLLSAVMLFILAVILAPFAEELLFRGWIYTSLRSRFGMWIALLVSSAVFAGLHYEDTHIYALVVFPIGLALGALRERTGSLKASISFHAFFNATAYVLAALDLG